MIRASTQPLSPHAVPTVIPGYKTRIVNDRICLVDNLMRPRMSLDVPGVLIWKYCAQSKTIAAMHDALTDALPHSAQDAEKVVATTLRNFYRRRVISFRCDLAAVSYGTYHINLSELLMHVLSARGWKIARPGELAEFGFCTRWPENIQLAKYQTFDLFLTGNMNSKHLLAERIIHSGNGSLIPETYTSFTAFERNADRDGDTLWFVKLGCSGQQRDVYCFAGFDETMRQAEWFRQQYGRSPHVIQRGVANPYLIDGRKMTLRVHVLILADGSVYVYQNPFVKTQDLTYDAADTSAEVQFLHKGLSRTPFNEYPHLAPAMPEIGDSVSTIMNLFTDNYSFVEDKNCYALLGLDYVLDCNRRPYLIEINDRPGLLPGDPATSHYRNKLHIAQDWLEIVLEGRRDSRVGGFLEVT